MSQVERFMNLDWKRLLKLNQQKVLGLDIGSSAVKIVELRQDNGGWAVTAAGMVDVADGIESNGDHKETNIVKTIRKCLQSTTIRTKLAVCSVCGPEVAVRYFNFPSLPTEEIEGAILLEASQVCPFNVDDASVHYQLIPDGQDNVSGILVAATDKLIKTKRRLIKNASLENVLMDVDGLALLNCFTESEKPETGTTTAILNVGSSFANLAIMGDNGLPFIRDMAYAGNDIVREIATENDVSTETVSNILSGCENSGHPHLELGDSLAAACRKLITDVTETLRYYATHEKSESVETIFVCGGFARGKGVGELLDNQLPAAAVLWNPFDKISCHAGRRCEDILRKNGQAMAVAAGLAMRSI